MDLNFEVRAKFLRPVEEVFDVVCNPKILSRYFTTGGASAPLDAGKTVTWEFEDFPGAFPVKVLEMKKNELIVFEWEANDGAGKGAGYNTEVEIKFTSIDPKTTIVQIVETGWKESEKSLRAAVGNSQGWMQMICCMKAYIEYGINLRKGFL